MATYLARGRDGGAGIIDAENLEDAQRIAKAMLGKDGVSYIRLEDGKGNSWVLIQVVWYNKEDNPHKNLYGFHEHWIEHRKGVMMKSTLWIENRVVRTFEAENPFEAERIVHAATDLLTDGKYMISWSDETNTTIFRKINRRTDWNTLTGE